MAYLPTSPHLFSTRDAAGVTAPTSLPQKWKYPWVGIPHSPPKSLPPEDCKICQKGPEASANDVHHRNLPGGLFRGAGQRNWTFLSGQPSDACSIASRVKGRGQRRSGVLWKVQDSQVSPLGLGCSPHVHMMQPCARAQAPPQLSCFTWTVQCSLLHLLLWVCARTTCSGQWCAQVRRARVCPHCACTRARTTCAHRPCLILQDYKIRVIDFAPIWINAVYKLSSLKVLQSDEKLVNPKMMRMLGEGPCSASCSQVNRSIAELLLAQI